MKKLALSMTAQATQTMVAGGDGGGGANEKIGTAVPVEVLEEVVVGPIRDTLVEGPQAHLGEDLTIHHDGVKTMKRGADDV